MTENTEEKPLVIAEELIKLATALGQQQNMTLVELIGHMEIAKTEVLARNIRAAEQASLAASPAEDGDKESEEASSPELVEDKA